MRIIRCTASLGSQQLSTTCSRLLHGVRRSLKRGCHPQVGLRYLY